MIRGKSNSFIRIGKKGAVVPISKETYLRDDIPCGVEGCHTCASPSPLVPNRQILIPDTNIFLHDFDIMCHAAIDNVVVLQTVLDEIKHQNVSVYERLRSLLKSRHFFVFSNEIHKDTYVSRESGETPNDRNDRALRVSAAWYQTHLALLSVSILFLTNDVDNLYKAKHMHVPSSSLRIYVAGLGDATLLDMLRSRNFLDGPAVYPDHLSANALLQGLEAGQFIKGMLSVSSYNVCDGWIVANVDGMSQTVHIRGRELLNRAIHGDVVAVQMFPKGQCGSMLTELLCSDTEEDHDSDPSATIKSDLMCGRVVGILRRIEKRFCGSVVEGSVEKKEDMVWIRFRPMDSRYPVLMLQTSQLASLEKQRIIVAFEDWPISSKRPLGRYVKTIGPIGDRETETELILLENEVPHSAFSNAVLKCLPAEGSEWMGSADGRLDLRKMDNLCSIDPPGCTDIDDALHVRKLATGGIEIGVHIADVSYFVRPHTAIDTEAARRGTTVYLVDRRIDMLPELLGSDLCSLRSGVDRYALSCLMELEKDMSVTKVQFSRTIIRSTASLTYEAAQKLIDSGKGVLADSLRLLDSVAKRLREKRMEAGALDLSSSEVVFNLDPNTSDPVGISSKPLLDTNHLVEEFMLLANIEAAKNIWLAFPEQALLRRHPSPQQDGLDWLQMAMQTRDLPLLDTKSSLGLQKSLDAAKMDILRVVVTRAMMQAVYFSTASVARSEFRHYGLATPFYTHFTSPIRRYADLVVHRLILQATGLESSVALGKTALEELAMHLNDRHRRAQQASRASVGLFAGFYLKSKNSTQETAHVVRVLSNGIVLFIPKFGTEVSVRLPADTAARIHDADRMVWLRQDNTVFVRIFDSLPVTVSWSDRLCADLVNKH